MAAAERIEAGAELRYAWEEAGERLPERGEEAPVFGDVRALLSGDSREGDEDEEEEDDGDAKPHSVRLGALEHEEDLRGRSGSATMAGRADLQEVVCGCKGGKAGEGRAWWAPSRRFGCPALPGKELRGWGVARRVAGRS